MSWVSVMNSSSLSLASARASRSCRDELPLSNYCTHQYYCIHYYYGGGACRRGTLPACPSRTDAAPQGKTNSFYNCCSLDDGLIFDSSST